MQFKNSTFNNCNLDILKKIRLKANSPKKTTLLITLLIFLFLAISIIFISNVHESIRNNGRASSVADFKLTINKLSEATTIIESERKLNNYSMTNIYGSDGKLINISEITPDLQKALLNIADKNNDGTVSDKEISNLKIMRLNPDTLKKEFNELQLNLNSADCNLKNYLVITQGKYAGTILYDGPLKFIDNEDNRYFGLDLSD